MGRFAPLLPELILSIGGTILINVLADEPPVRAVRGRAPDSG